jgi:arginine-tRNA-protein transferase
MEKLVYDGLQACPYLPGQVARLPLYRQLRPLGPDRLDDRLAQAERRVGSCTYRTACPTCSACEGIRVPVATFAPSRSQRRVLARCADVRVEMGPAEVSDARLELFARHKQVRGLAGADEPAHDTAEYDNWLVRTCTFTMEMRYWLGERLVGVGVVDVGRTALSSVYFYYEPDSDVARLSLGVFSVLQEIALCRRTGRTHLYLGLYVADCRHLAYKADYGPHERYRDGRWEAP